MKTKLARLNWFMLALLLGASTLVAFTPGAVAQANAVSSTKVELKTPDLPNGRLMPESMIAEIGIVTTVTLQNVGSGCVVPVTVKYVVLSPPSWSAPVLNPQTDTGQVTANALNPNDPNAQKLIFNSKLLVSTTREAPAFKDDTYKVKADVTFGATTSGCTIAPSSGDGQTNIKNDYIPLTQVAPAQYFQKSGQNKKVVFPIDLTNLGNGPSRVKLEVTQPNKNKLDSIIPPAELHMESRTKGASAVYKANTRIEAQTPHSNGYTNSIYSFNVKVMTTYDGAGTGTTTDETAVTLSVQVQGVYVPGFEPASAIAALGLALLAFGFVRRRSG